MKKLKTHTSIILINPISFTLFILFNQSYSLDPNFDLCVPKDCGNGLNISYPFYIKGLQDITCGNPGFEILCDVHGSATIQISDNNYTIKEIRYKDNTFRVENSKFLSPCTSTLIKNVTLDSIRFGIDNHLSKSNMILLSNCLSNISSNFDKYKINSCDGGEYVMLDNDVNFENVSRDCNRIVATPVDGDFTVVDGGNYGEVVERGFVMRWLAAGYCGECETSGGRCGFNTTGLHFQCFCTDRPHKVSCKPGKNLYVML